MPTAELALSLVALEFPGDARRRLGDGISWARSIGLRSVYLDGTARGVRPRELDRSSRRDVAAIARREGVRIAGVDLWIPPEHYVDDARSERAIESALSSIRFIGEVGPLSSVGMPTGVAPVLSVTLPRGDRAMDVRALLAETASAHDVRIADHDWPPIVEDEWAHDHLGVGIDPATVQLSGEGLSPGRVLAREASRVVSARLSDTDGSVRVPAGEGRLSLFEYVATALTCGLETPLVIDLREVASPMASAARIIHAAEGGSTV